MCCPHWSLARFNDLRLITDLTHWVLAGRLRVALHCATKFTTRSGAKPRWLIQDVPESLDNVTRRCEGRLTVLTPVCGANPRWLRKDVQESLENVKGRCEGRLPV